MENHLRDEPEQCHPCRKPRCSAFGAVEELLKIIRDDYSGAKALALANAEAKKQDKPKKSLAELSMAEQAWMGLSVEDQKAQVNLVLDDKIRPALMADGGNVEVLDVVDGEKIMIQYQGACGSCGSSLGATLSFMEQALRSEIYNELIVVPNM